MVSYTLHSKCTAESSQYVSAALLPDENLSYKDIEIPHSTPVSNITTLSVHTNNDAFPYPWAFKPEPWIGLDGYRETEVSKSIQFNKGGRS